MRILLNLLLFTFAFAGPKKDQSNPANWKLESLCPMDVSTKTKIRNYFLNTMSDKEKVTFNEYIKSLKDEFTRLLGRIDTEFTFPVSLSTPTNVTLLMLSDGGIFKITNGTQFIGLVVDVKDTTNGISCFTVLPGQGYFSHQATIINWFFDNKPVRKNYPGDAITLTSLHSPNKNTFSELKALGWLFREATSDKAFGVRSILTLPADEQNAALLELKNLKNAFSTGTELQITDDVVYFFYKKHEITTPTPSGTGPLIGYTAKPLFQFDETDMMAVQISLSSTTVKKEAFEHLQTKQQQAIQTTIETISSLQSPTHGIIDLKSIRNMITSSWNVAYGYGVFKVIKSLLSLGVFIITPIEFNGAIIPQIEAFPAKGQETEFMNVIEHALHKIRQSLPEMPFVIARIIGANNVIIPQLNSVSGATIHELMEKNNWKHVTSAKFDAGDAIMKIISIEERARHFNQMLAQNGLFAILPGGLESVKLEVFAMNLYWFDLFNVASPKPQPRK